MDCQVGPVRKHPTLHFARCLFPVRFLSRKTLAQIIHCFAHERIATF